MPLPPPPMASATQPTPEILVVIPQPEFTQLKSEIEQKQYLGNYLYQFVSRKIQKIKPEQVDSLSGKVTGMILDGQSVDFILFLCSNKAAFYNIVEEALLLIEKSEKKEEAPAP
jgi:hypothetical protein